MRLAQRIGAELAITGTVQKVSNLILNMNIYVRKASTGATIAAMSADMRGNTDETWSRTLDWLVRNRLLAPGYGLQRQLRGEGPHDASPPAPVPFLRNFSNGWTGRRWLEATGGRYA